MNSAQRKQILAAKERLHQLKIKAEEEEARKLAQEKREEIRAEELLQEKVKGVYQQKKAKIEAEREKARLEARAREEEEYLRRHNKTVTKVLSQVANYNPQGETEDDDEGEEDGEDSEENNSEAPSATGTDRGKSSKKTSTEGQKAKGKGNETNPFHGKYPGLFDSLKACSEKSKGCYKRRDGCYQRQKWLLQAPEMAAISASVLVDHKLDQTGCRSMRTVV